EPEQLDLLRGCLLRQQHLQVMCLTMLESPAALGEEGLATMARLGEEGRDGGQEQHQDRPWTEAGEQRAVAGDRDQVAPEPEQLADDVERPGARLAPRLARAVVEDPILEITKAHVARLL